MSKLRYSLKAQMDGMKDHMGERITVLYTAYGKERTETGTMDALDPFHTIEVGTSGIPFIGTGSVAIKRITEQNGSVIYENPRIHDGYNGISYRSRMRLLGKCFGIEYPRAYKRALKDMRDEKIVKTSKLKALFRSGELNERQYRSIKSLDNGGIVDRGYMLMVVKAAKEVYAQVADICTKEDLEMICEDAVNISNLGAGKLDPTRNYHEASMRIASVLDGQNHSGYSMPIVVKEFINIVREEKKIDSFPKEELSVPNSGYILTI